jgi:hypothetical protein
MKKGETEIPGIETLYLLPQELHINPLQLGIPSPYYES